MLPLLAEFTSLILQSRAISNAEWIHVWEATAHALWSNHESIETVDSQPFSYYTYNPGEPNRLQVVTEYLILPFY